MSKSNIESEFISFIQKELIESCNLMQVLASENCVGSYLDDESCAWYHSAWQYLRVLDKVSSPTWHFDFYFGAFNSLLSNKTNILISGTADYTILALIYFVARKKNVSPNVWVCDICNTPLLICQHFAKRNNFPISVLKGDIKLIEFAESYDIVTSDAFLTRFAYAEKELIIKKWFSILSEKGSIITTARIEDKINQNDAIKTDSKKVFYKREVELAVKDTLLVNQVDKVKNLAGEYISHIISIPFTSDGEIVDIFSKYSLKIQHGENVIVKGEVKQTKYYRLIAQKMSNNIDVRTDT